MNAKYPYRFSLTGVGVSERGNVLILSGESERITHNRYDVVSFLRLESVRIRAENLAAHAIVATFASEYTRNGSYPYFWRWDGSRFAEVSQREYNATIAHAVDLQTVASIVRGAK